VPRTLAASSMGLVVGAGELFGGVAAPTVAGAIADQMSLIAPMVVMMVCAVVAGILSLFLKETAPGRTQAVQSLQMAKAA
jgi:ACS family hexuronate transporter-like MFS transporter